ncbi:cyclin H [Nematocida minor]|uniref:cyclin H n=1 Tax=Nematocida minor TaxID=1912983 RepID=UPI00222080E2|nr:cyclin H [Nematocida minor]KAI5192407.1 cyclin H [Nematocida minor]
MSESVTMDITKEEENTFLFYYQIKMLGLCDHLNIPVQIQSTAITYFKILFTKRRVFHYDMKNLIVACVLLAMKVENVFMTATHMKEQLNFANVKLLAAYELEICNALKFNLHVASPHLRLLGLFLLLKNRERVIAEMDGQVQTQDISETDEALDWAQSVENLKILMLLDNYHTLDLNQVAMASLPVQPSCLEGFFMKDTIEAVKDLKKQMKRRELPSHEQVAKIEKKIATIQKKYKILEV